MPTALTFDHPGVVHHDDRAVAMDAVERVWLGCRERLGGLGVSQPYFRTELEAVKTQERFAAVEKRFAYDDFYFVLSLRIGNDDAWRRFDSTYRGYLLRLATRYAGSRERAEDLVTDLYADLVARPGRPGKLEHYKGYAALSTWLAVIVRRMSFDRGRMLDRRDQRLLRLKRERMATTVSPNPEALLSHAQSRQLVATIFADALGALDSQHILVLSLLYQDGLTLREAGRIMDLDFSTVSRRAKAARAALQKRMRTLAREAHGLSDDEIADLFTSGASGASFAVSRDGASA